MRVTFEIMSCQKCGWSWKLPLTRTEVDQIISVHKIRCDGAPAPRWFER